MIAAMETTVGYSPGKIFMVDAWFDKRGVPRVRWEFKPISAYTKEGTPIEFLESGISCPEVHEYFNNYVKDAGYSDE